ncbi:hypothetical protein [Mycetocola saprophilus]|uniref:hypothetical protein n=1 Tax=Mycetocola saprophilus TaxID=76636 RepID=UPI003BF541B9
MASLIVSALALTSSNPQQRWGWALFLGVIISLGWMASTFLRIPSLGTTRIVALSSGVSFVPPRDIFFAPYVFIVFLINATVFQSLDLGSERVHIQMQVWAIAALLVGLLGLGWNLRRSFFPTGLMLNPERITGVRGDKLVKIPWASLEDVSVVSGQGPYLSLFTTDHTLIRIDSRFTGTDVNVLYWTVRYFLDHPEQRELLRDPEAALRRVEETYRVADPG